MSWSRVQQLVDSADQLALLIGSAVRLLGGEAGIFIVSNEVFDPQSMLEYTEYIPIAINQSLFLDLAQRMPRPDSQHLMVRERLDQDLVSRLGLCYDEMDVQNTVFDLCAAFIADPVGIVGFLYFIHPASRDTWLESRSEISGDIGLFLSHLAISLRSILRVQTLRVEQQRLAAIFQQSSEGILTVDRMLRIIDFNPAMERLTGWRESEVLGRFYYEVLRPRDRLGNDLGLIGSPIMQAFAGQIVTNREMVIVARDGERFEVAVTASCVRNAAGEPMSGILNMRDITWEREQEEQRSTFISVVSHELQTPIAIIKGYASTLARTDAVLEPEALQKRLGAIEEEADRLNKLVGNLLYASRIQAGGLQMEVVPLDLTALVESVARRLQARAPDFEIQMDLPAHLPHVMADRDRIEEVLLNLLDNAIKYSPTSRTVVVACRASSEEVITSISDTGMGISIRDQEQIFDRFQRVEGRMTRSRPGAGLGLFICRAIVEAHGGRIWVESMLRQGSTFLFSLPREERAQLPMVVF